MAEHLGKDMMCQVWDVTADNGNGDYVNVSGLDGREWVRTLELADITTADDDDPTKLLVEKMLAVMKTYGFSGDAIFKTAARYALVNDAFEAVVTIKFRIVLPEIGSWTCDDGFWVTEIKDSAGNKDPLAYSIAFKPAGEVGFLAV